MKSQHETIVANQIVRAGTGIGANIHEAQYAYCKADFIAKQQITLKEANETSYQLELLLKTNYINEAKHQELDTACSQFSFLKPDRRETSGPMEERFWISSALLHSNFSGSSGGSFAP